jgi:hypothetical protein
MIHGFCNSTCLFLFLCFLLQKRQRSHWSLLAEPKLGSVCLIFQEMFNLDLCFYVMKMRGSPSQVKGAGLRTLSRRGSWVRIPPPAPCGNPVSESDISGFVGFAEEGLQRINFRGVQQKIKTSKQTCLFRQSRRCDESFNE